jgi:hypothetical protein
MSDTDQFIGDLKSQYGEPGHDKSHPMAPWGGGFLQKGMEYGAAFARGGLQGALDAPGVKTFSSMVEPQFVKDFLTEKKHPEVAGAGSYVTPGTVALGALPDLGMLAAKAGAPLAVRAGSKLAQNAWKSTLGGASQAKTDTKTPEEAASNVSRGAAEGLGTGLAVTGAQAAARSMPYWMLPAVIAGGELAGGRFMPWHIRHAIAAGLTALALRAARIPAGLVGAGGEAAAQQTGNEPGGSEGEQPEPF